MKRVFILIAALCLGSAALAQKADAAFVVGGSFVSDVNGTLPPPFPTTPVNIKTDHHFFLEGALGVRLLNAHVVSLYAELPVAGIPSTTVTQTISLSSATLVDHLTTVFITPGVRVKILASAPISPWASVGGGWGHYGLDSGTSTSKGAWQYGGGLDFKTGLPLLGFRAEVRDFVTGDPHLNQVALAASPGQHHNILAGGGLVLRF